MLIERRRYGGANEKDGKEMLIEGKEMRQKNARVFKSEEGDTRDLNCFQTPNNEWNVKWWHAQIEWDVIY